MIVSLFILDSTSIPAIGILQAEACIFCWNSARSLMILSRRDRRIAYANSCVRTANDLQIIVYLRLAKKSRSPALGAIEQSSISSVAEPKSTRDSVAALLRSAPAPCDTHMLSNARSGREHLLPWEPCAGAFLVAVGEVVTWKLRWGRVIIRVFAHEAVSN